MTLSGAVDRSKMAAPRLGLGTPRQWAAQPPPCRGLAVAAGMPRLCISVFLFLTDYTKEIILDVNSLTF